MQSEVMNRGTDALKSHMSDCEKMEISQTRRGCFQEILGCEARTEFKYYIGGNHVASSLEDAGCIIRMFCSANYPFTTEIKEVETEAELLSIDRPCRLLAGPCKCCCFQEASFSSNNNDLGRIKETCWYCVPSYKIYDHEEKQKYLLHPPTCLGGMCINCCAEGNPLGGGCFRISFRIFPADQSDTDGDAPYLGMILKKPKSLLTEVFTDAAAYEVEFPKEATINDKGILMGTTIFINAIHFEGNEGQ